MLLDKEKRKVQNKKEKEFLSFLNKHQAELRRLADLREDPKYLQKKKAKLRKEELERKNIKSKAKDKKNKKSKIDYHSRVDSISSSSSSSTETNSETDDETTQFLQHKVLFYIFSMKKLLNLKLKPFL